eukprot:scaffold75017_cov15-Tisochrysis_lutea.AAC.1
MECRQIRAAGYLHAYTKDVTFFLLSSRTKRHRHKSTQQANPLNMIRIQISMTVQRLLCRPE